MNTNTILESIELTVMRCGMCGISFAMPEYYRAERKEDGGVWYCPNGHQRVFRESDVQIARAERDAALRKLTEAKCEVTAERSARELAEKVLKNHQKRTKNGVCPCCKRSFVNLRRHIATQHPTFAV
jgi:hypothetical protein